jgi:hypothetical protein
MKNLDIKGISPEAIEAMQKLKDNKDVDPKTAEALKAVELAGNLVDSIMSGRHVDVAYLKLFANLTTNRLLKNTSRGKDKK